MNLLVVSPDYLSHYLPLSAVAAAARAGGAAVTVATGEALRSRVEADGSAWTHLRLARSANAGTPRLDPDLAAFFDATRRGMVATLAEQARARGDDLLWEPATVARDVLGVVERVRPDAVLVDHLAFGATLALRAAGVPFTTFVPGHPCQLPAPGEVYGHPVAWPAAISADPAELASLRWRCEEATARFTARYNDVLADLNAAAAPVDDAFAAHGADVLFNSPAALADPARSLPAAHAFLGSCVRAEVAPDDVRTWLDRTGPGFTYVSFGTFLSARTDVVRTVLAALAERGGPVAVATGVAEPDELGPPPDGWLVAPTLPQVALLAGAGLVVTHGGNNTVTESLTAGVPMVVAPFSTDQFAVAADVERAGLGVAVDPNRATAGDWACAVEQVAASAPIGVRAQRLGAELRSDPGPDIAVRRLAAGT